MSRAADKINIELNPLAFENVIWGSRAVSVRAHVLWGSNTSRNHVLWGSNTRGTKPTGKPVRK